MLLDNNKFVDLILGIVRKRLAVLNLSSVDVVVCSKCRSYVVYNDDTAHLHDAECLYLYDHHLMSLSYLGVLSQYKFAVTIFHELRHIMQSERHKTDISYDYYPYTLAFFTRISCEEYYMNRMNYYHNIKELDAMLYGMEQSYLLFIELYGTKIADAVFFAYINNFRTHNTGAYKYGILDAGHEYAFPDEVFEIYSHEIELCPYRLRECMCFKDNDSLYSKLLFAQDGIQQDELIVRDFLLKHEYMYDDLLKCTPGLKFLSML